MFWRKKKLENKTLAYLQTETDLLKSRVTALERNEIALETFVKNKIKKASVPKEDEDGISMDDLNQVKEAFGGSLPIELVERYKNQRE